MAESRGASENPEPDAEEAIEQEETRTRRGSNTPTQRVERAVVNPPEKRGGSHA